MAAPVIAAAKAGKAAGAFRTIGELSRDTGIAPHILRYWETRFPELRPLQRGGGRRYYRPEDAALVARIEDLLNRQGYTIRGVQQLLASERKRGIAAMPATATADVDPLRVVRDALVQALAEDTTF